ncbi:hypothetical protein GC175_32135 [bacterium]|nr:hypothetical protein [bacterium]
MHNRSLRRRWLRIFIPLALFLLGCPSSGQPYQPIVITVGGQVTHLIPGSSATLLVQGWENFENVPAADAEVTISLSSGDELYSGRTDDAGLLLANFVVPEDVETGEQVLSVEVRTDDESAAYDETIYVGRTYSVLVSTDKPVYQPGQMLHARALALNSLALAAAEDEIIVFTVDDPEGNRLLRQEIATSEWGIAAVDFELDAQAMSGDYILTAALGPVTSSRSVEVKPYNLPRFKVDFAPDRTFYLPGDVARGTVSANYFFGKPVAGGEVRIEGFLGSQQIAPIFELTGETDADGNYSYEFVVPDSFIGQLGNESAEIDLTVTVIDTAAHAESIDETVTVAEQPLLLDAVPESGVLRTNLENIVYLQVTSPDGSSIPAELTITFNEGTRTVTSDEFGLATISITPVDALDAALDVEIRPLNLDIAPVQTRVLLVTRFQDTAVLLRPERAEVAVGDTLNLDFFVTGNVETVYLDIAKGKQTFGLVTLPVVDGMAQAAIDIDGSLLGTLDLNAYAINERGNIVRDRRFVLVNPAPAAITITADKEVYRPGEEAVLDIDVSRDGAPMPSALGVAIVDESVFALGAQDPGFVRTFFLLDRELDEPWYEIRNFAPLADDDPSPYDGKVRPLRANTDPIAVQRARDLALFGFFGEELASTSPAPKVADTAAEDRLAMILGWTARAGIALPLLGIGFYDGSQKRRRLLIGLVLLGMASFLWGACASAAPASEAPAAAEDFAFEEAASESAQPASDSQPEPPRLRQFFPETLFWLPEVVTDQEGRAQLTVPVADTITTWRVSIVASDKDGNLGSAQTGLRVFQDFFVEPNLPRFLTVGDEVSVPVSLFNYLDEPQTIQIAVDAADWFEFTGDATLTVDLAAAEVSVAYIPIRITGFGDHTFTVTATGSVLSDAVQRPVQILPDGQARQDVANGTLEEMAQASVSVPADAVAGASFVTVKIYPGVVSQLVDGLNGMLREPYGCFEQVTSVNYPNVMILDYLRNSEQLSPRIERQAERFVDLGYQRLLTFETEIPGGFSFYGDPPPLDMLTAYGLMQLTDMSRVRYVDPDLLQRMSVYLLDRQNGDHWTADGYNYSLNDDFTATAYVTWALAEAGYGNTLPLRRAAQYLARNVDKLSLGATSDAAATPISISPMATPISISPLATPIPTEAPPSASIYSLALTANALLAMDDRDRDALDLLDQLVPLAQEDESGLYWVSDSMLGYGYAANIETTALMFLALQRSGQHPDLAQSALDYLIAQRQPYGAFGSTQSTVLVLKALINDALANRSDNTATVTVTFNGGRTQSFTIDDTNADVMQQVVFDDIGPGEQIVDLRVEGDRPIQYQVTAGYYLPWSLVETDAPERQQPMRIDVAYARAELAVNETVAVTAMVEVLAPGNAGTVLLEIGVPPGLSPVAADLDALVEDGRIDRYEFTGRTLRLYASGLANGFVYEYQYRLRAEYPVDALIPSSQVYDYYTPDRQDITPPQRIKVTLNVP